MEDEAKLLEWADARVSELLEMDSCPEVAEYFVRVDTDEDVREYANTVLGDSSATAVFCKELLARRRALRKAHESAVPAEPEPPVRSQPRVVPAHSVSDSGAAGAGLSLDFDPVYDDEPPCCAENIENDGSAVTCCGLREGQRQRNSVLASLAQLDAVLPGRRRCVVVCRPVLAPAREPLVLCYAVPASVGVLAGLFVLRIFPDSSCGCFGTRHKAVANCLDCGRIACEQEGEGPCYFCGSVVVKGGGEVAERQRRRIERLIASHHQKAKQEGQSSALLQQKSETTGETTIQGAAGGLENGASAKAAASERAAVELKDRLLDYQRTSAQRTVVYDDHADYYESETNIWLSEEERKQARARETARDDAAELDRRTVRVTIDLAGQRVTEAAPRADVPPSSSGTAPKSASQSLSERESDRFQGHAAKIFERLRAIGQRAARDTKSYAGRVRADGASDDVDSGNNASANVQHRLRTLRRVQDERHRGDPAPPASVVPKHRVTDHAQDKGRCLSLHQPWASLVVAGIKRVEGRSWTSQHRGRLWIASTVRPAEEVEVAAVEAEYAALGFTHFPKTYPTSALLGCVNMVNCLPHEEYSALPDPKEHSETAFQFIFEDACHMVVPRAISGEHKIYTLSRDALEAAQCALIAAPLPATRAAAMPSSIDEPAIPSTSANSAAQAEKIELATSSLTDDSFPALRVERSAVALQVGPGITVLRGALAEKAQRALLAWARQGPGTDLPPAMSTLPAALTEYTGKNKRVIKDGSASLMTVERFRVDERNDTLLRAEHAHDLVVRLGIGSDAVLAFSASSPSVTGVVQPRELALGSGDIVVATSAWFTGIARVNEDEDDAVPTLGRIGEHVQIVLRARQSSE